MRNLRLTLVATLLVIGVAAKLHRTTASASGGLRAIEGWIPSLSYGFGIVLLVAGLPIVARQSARARWVLCGGAAFGAVASEFLQTFQRGQTFAWADAIAAFAGGAAGLAFELWAHDRS